MVARRRYAQRCHHARLKLLHFFKSYRYVQRVSAFSRVSRDWTATTTKECNMRWTSSILERRCHDAATRHRRFEIMFWCMMYTCVYIYIYIHVYKVYVMWCAVVWCGVVWSSPSHVSPALYVCHVMYVHVTYTHTYVHTYIYSKGCVKHLATSTVAHQGNKLWMNVRLFAKLVHLLLIWLQHCVLYVSHTCWKGVVCRGRRRGPS